MTRPMKLRWILAGLCSLVALIAGGRETQAGTSSITITGGYKPGGGDPPYLYIFDVYLNAPDVSTPGTNTFQSGNSFTIDGLPGVNSSSLVNEPPTMLPGVAWFAPAFSPGPPPPPPNSGVFSSDVTFTFGGSDVYSATTPPGGPVGASVLLGQFTVLSTYDFTSPPYPPGFLVTYTFTANGGGSGTFPIMDLSVPEPTSMALLGIGAGGLPLFWLRNRRRLPKQEATR